MKITKQQLKKLIKEELKSVLSERVGEGPTAAMTAGMALKHRGRREEVGDEDEEGAFDFGAGTAVDLAEVVQNFLATFGRVGEEDVRRASSDEFMEYFDYALENAMYGEPGRALAEAVIGEVERAIDEPGHPPMAP